MEDRKVKMTINIAGETIPLTVSFDQQDLVRETEKNVGELYDNWSKRFAGKSTQHLLAMIAYQYASYYLGIRRIQGEAREKLNEISQGIDDMLADK